MIIASGVGAGLAISANVNNVVPASFWQSFGAFATPVDLIFSVVKAVLFAFIVVVIASLRGLEGQRWPQGRGQRGERVGRAQCVLHLHDQPRGQPAPDHVLPSPIGINDGT